MSASTAIGMIGESLKTLLEEEMAVTPSAPVSLLAPDENGPQRRINLFLYKVQENSFFKNKDWEVSQSDPNQITPPPLSLNLYYLLTPHAVNDAQNGNVAAHEILGDAMRVLHQFPVIPNEHLAPGLVDSREQIKIIQVPVDMDELSKVWSTFSTPFRMSVAYEISVVQLDQADDTTRDMPTRVSTVGVPDIIATHRLPRVNAIEPLSGPAGTVVTISGDNLGGWRACVDIGTERVMDGDEISGNSIDVTVPPTLSGGFHRVRVDISRLHRSTFYFEVAP